jgi:hypothetical protein
MSKHNPERIRNVKGFLRSYMKSSSGQRALNRQPSFVEVENETTKGRIITGYNTLAHALNEAAQA